MKPVCSPSYIIISSNFQFNSSQTTRVVMTRNVWFLTKILISRSYLEFPTTTTTTATTLLYKFLTDFLHYIYTLTTHKFYDSRLGQDIMMYNIEELVKWGMEIDVLSLSLSFLPLLIFRTYTQTHRMPKQIQYTQLWKQYCWTSSLFSCCSRF